MEKIQLLVDGGKANPGPPLGPALGPTGVKIPDVVSAINEKTKVFEGMKVPVTIVIDSARKSFEVEVGTPPTSALILKEIKKESGSGKAKTEIIGNIDMPAVVKIAKMKMDSMLGKNMRMMVKSVVGTCRSMGVTVEGKDLAVVMKEIDQGVYDSAING